MIIDTILNIFMIESLLNYNKDIVLSISNTHPPFFLLNDVHESLFYS